MGICCENVQNTLSAQCGQSVQRPEWYMQGWKALSWQLYIKIRFQNFEEFDRINCDLLILTTFLLPGLNKMRRKFLLSYETRDYKI
jgi:hypothetical protein